MRSLGHIVALVIAWLHPAAVAAGQMNVVIQWNSAALQATRDSNLGPPIVSRALAIVHTCMYDAWVAYDDRAVGTQLGGALRRPASERTLANKEKSRQLRRVPRAHGPVADRCRFSLQAADERARL
jgi:hypothetical protein